MASERSWRQTGGNAPRSTGPRTFVGKPVSARTALQHGILALALRHVGAQPAMALGCDPAYMAPPALAGVQHAASPISAAPAPVP